MYRFSYYYLLLSFGFPLLFSENILACMFQMVASHHQSNTMVCLYPHWPSSKPGSHLRKEDSPLVFLHGRAKAPKAANDAVSSQHAPCFRQLSEVPAAMGLGRLCTGTAYNQPLRPTPDHLFPPHPSLSIPSTLP